MSSLINIFDKEIVSDRLKLRRVRTSDLDDVYEYSSNPSTTEFLFWETHLCKKQTLNFINTTINEYKTCNTRYTWGITLKENDKLIGVISIFFISYISKRVEISFVLNPKFQGNGYMNEALKSVIHFILFEVLFIRVQARCSEDNKASEKVLKSIGMKLEGKLQKYWFIKNRFKNVHLYALITI